MQSWQAAVEVLRRFAYNTMLVIWMLAQGRRSSGRAGGSKDLRAMETYKENVTK